MLAPALRGLSRLYAEAFLLRAAGGLVEPDAAAAVCFSSVLPYASIS